MIIILAKFCEHKLLNLKDSSCFLQHQEQLSFSHINDTKHSLHVNLSIVKSHGLQPYKKNQTKPLQILLVAD